MDKRRRLVDILALGSLVATTSHLGATYDSNIGFERPIHLSVLAVLLVSSVSFAIARHSTIAPTFAGFSAVPQEPAPPGTPAKAPTQLYDWARNAPGARFLLAAVNNVSRTGVGRALACIPAQVWILASLVAWRVILFWHVTRFMHCSWSSIQYFLPLVVSLLDTALPACRSRELRLPFSRQDPEDETKQVQGGGARQPRLYHVARTIGLALVWGLVATRMESYWENQTSTFCPRSSALGPSVSAAQLISLALDAAVLTMLSRTRMDDTSSRIAGGSSPGQMASSCCWGLLATACSISGALLFLIAAIFLAASGDPLRGAMLNGAEMPGLALDTIAVVLLLLSAVHLLATLSPATVTLVIVGLGSYARHLMSFPDQSLSQTEWAVAKVSAVALLVCTGLVLRWDRDAQLAHRSSTADTLAYKALTAIYVVVVATSLVSSASSQLARDAVLRDIPPLTTLISKANAESVRWQERAASSRTLDDAVEAYRQRHGIPPPPNFDKWVDFALGHNSPVIDEFAQISADLLPFWGVEPSGIRKQTSEMIRDGSRSMIGGLKIHKGEIELSPHTPGTHRWMMDGMANMIRPFAKWLPDMDLAFNLDDECRIAVPYEDQLLLLDSAHKAHARLLAISSDRMMATFELGGGAWPEPDHNNKDLTRSPLFIEHHAVPVFRDFVAPTCPPGSLARTWRWWNRKETCTRCAAPHTTLTSEGSVVSNWTLSGDVCHQPDLAYMDGFLLSPSTMRSTRKLMPVFSQSKVPGFADILHPSPWNYVGKVPYDADAEAADMPWAEKTNAVFWRGSATDGYADHGAWQSFLRARFVNGAGTMKSLLAAHPKPDLVEQQRLGVNVSFVDDFARCGQCRAEANHFYGPAGGSSSAASVPFVEHWRYRHLVDLDGAGFSGRFLPFLESRSLVYRAAVFRTWRERMGFTVPVAPAPAPATVSSVPTGRPRT
ncbi:hypothetical protein MAPG_11339 [Magnaporthiopsis poae ATCC 64411]|uniref:Glycosyl transferase CAP10 domain-containing protein n=1 Tax=Magnaporthiopsis poae (strain ATCC 64411 / 73-15) TaxID=644358 RepID=A0A0C4EF05_MAGP6|nr:hypothetical protein MAPG_11339 [Magnaporthiopsis poae ATCC 64411]